MATVCRKCGGIIADLNFGPNGEQVDRNDCKYHRKPEINLNW